MIKITDVGGTEKYINCDLIERIEIIPDTLLVLVNGNNIIVREDAANVISKIVEFRRSCGEAVSVISVEKETAEEEQIQVQN